MWRARFQWSRNTSKSQDKERPSNVFFVYNLLLEEAPKSHSWRDGDWAQFSQSTGTNQSDASVTSLDTSRARFVDWQRFTRTIQKREKWILHIFLWFHDGRQRGSLFTSGCQPTDVYTVVLPPNVYLNARRRSYHIPARIYIPVNLRTSLKLCSTRLTTPLVRELHKVVARFSGNGTSEKEWRLETILSNIIITYQNFTRYNNSQIILGSGFPVKGWTGVQWLFGLCIFDTASSGTCG